MRASLVTAMLAVALASTSACRPGRVGSASMASPPGGCWRFSALRLAVPAALTFSLGLCLAGPLCLALLRAMSAMALPPLQQQVQ
jgi:hypothetical protein